MNRSLVILCAVLGFTGVAFGAFGAHGLKASVEHLADGAQRLAWWETGSRYHLWHALAVGLAAALAANVRSPLPKVAASLFLAGIVLFSGSLYVMALTGIRWLGAITPFGGFSMLLGWTLLGIAARRLPLKTEG
jgi:uncharacterized membrane protein YgdD (TMEM256/DUF423 family)